jgi:hypothetical protein
MPPIIPVIMPIAAAFSGGAPEAMATPIHNGKATKNTTNDAKRSFFMDPNRSFFIGM